MNIVAEIVLFIFWLLMSFVFLFTGDIVLMILTIGKHRPTWSRYREKSSISMQVFAELIFWIGLGTWIVILIFAEILIK
jgi:hypothetical protein